MEEQSPQVRCAVTPQVYAPPAVGPIRSLVYIANALLASFYLVLALLVSAPPSDKPSPTQCPDVSPPRPCNKALIRASRRKAISPSSKDSVRRSHLLLDVMLRTSLQPQQALVFAQTVLRPLATASATYTRACPTADALALELKICLATRKLYAECTSSYTVELTVRESHLVQHSVCYALSLQGFEKNNLRLVHTLLIARRQYSPALSLSTQKSALSLIATSVFNKCARTMYFDNWADLQPMLNFCLVHSAPSLCSVVLSSFVDPSRASPDYIRATLLPSLPALWKWGCTNDMLALVCPVSRHILALWRTQVLGAPPAAGNNPNAAAQAWARECECRACGIMQRWVLRPNARAVVDVGIVGLRHKVHFLGLLKKHGRRLVDGWTHIYGAEHCYFFTIRKSQELSVLHQFLNERQLARESLQGLDWSEICDSETLSFLVDA